MTRRALPCLGALLLAACSSGPPPVPPDNALPAAYGAAPAVAAQPVAADWWTLFGEPGLNQLVGLALAHNLDLRLAAARIDETAQALGLARAAQWPSLDLGGSVTRSRSSTLNGQPTAPGGPEATTHRLALSTSFEIDLWGRLRHASAAAQQQLLAAEQAQDTVRLALVGAVAQTWFGLRALEAQIAVVAEQGQLRGESQALVERRLNAGLASGLELAQARGAVAAAAVQQLELQRQRSLLQHQLGALTGQPGLVPAAPGSALPQPVQVPPGLPSQLLERRPDVQRSAALMRAAFEQFDVVRKSAWPTLALTGSFGSQSADLVDLLRVGARTWSLGPQLLVSLFDAGRSRARSEQARAQAEQAAIGWQQSAQTAFREVADALSNAESTAAQEQQLERQRSAAQEAQRIATRRYEAGYAGYLEVLDAQRAVLDAELAWQRTRQARLDASVALLKALGGGWQAGPTR